MKYIFLFLVIGYLPSYGQDNQPNSWEDCTSVQDVYDIYPDRVHNLFNKLDLTHSGLEEVKSAVDKRDFPEACRSLLDYYASKSKNFFQNIPDRDFNLQTAQYAVNDTFVITNYKSHVPRTEDGGLNWRWVPENYYNNQWHQITRHSWWMDLLYAYKETGEAIYGEYLDKIIRDWTLHERKFNVFKLQGPYGWVKSGGPDRLDAGIRMNRWPQLFYTFYNSPHFHDATKILMLNSIFRHGDYLEDTWKKHNNHVIMEMNGLANIAVSFDEFKNSEHWLDLSFDTFTREFDRQILPDGAQYELAHGYHQVVIREYLDFKRLINQAGKTFDKELNQKLEKAINYTAYVVNPQQQRMANNDSEETDLQNWLLTRAEEYGREDWRYIATNGQEGEKPEGYASVMFPWAGHLISRNNWSENAHWSFFDVGPYGTNHQHRDKLHISIYAHGRKLLVDNGKYTYKNNRWREFFQESRSHNVITVNHQSQKPYKQVYDTAFNTFEITEKADFARDTYSEGWENGIEGKHTRAMVYLKDRYWIVFDRVDVGQNDIQALWHFRHEADVERSGQMVKTNDTGKGNLMIKPVADFSWQIQMKKGQENPIQGWESIDHIRHPAYCAEFSTDVQGPTNFAWVLYPKDGLIEDQHVKASIVKETENYMHVEIQEKGKSGVEVIVRLNSGQNPIEIRDGLVLEGDYKIVE